MPHIVVEHSKRLFDEVTRTALLEALHKRVADEPSVDIKAIKTRSIPLEDVIVGDEHDADLMIHITVRLLPGRSVEVRKGISSDAIKIAHEFLDRCGKDGVSVSAEIVEMPAETYSK